MRDAEKCGNDVLKTKKQKKRKTHFTQNGIGDTI
jgi:hypothetical protein